MKVAMLKDKNGNGLHRSPPLSPVCPAIYQNELGQIVLVGKTILTTEVDTCIAADDESIVTLPKDLLAQFVQSVNDGTITL